MPALIYKIVPAALWQEAETRGGFTGSPVDVSDGFIHLSTAEQLAETAQKHFVGQGNLLLITVDTAQLDVRWEPSRGGQLFPHLYGPLPLSAVRLVEPYEAPAVRDTNRDPLPDSSPGARRITGLPAQDA